MNALIADHPDREVSIELQDTGAGSFEYTIGSSHCADLKQQTPHSRGSIEFQTLRLPAPLDVDALHAVTSVRCLQQAPFYARFSAQGVSYEDASRGVRLIQVGESQVLANIGLPDEETRRPSQLVLHPTLLDAAFQAIAAIDWDGAAGAYAEPCELEELYVYRPSTNAVYAWVSPSDEGTDTNTGSAVKERRKFDIDLCERDGTICVRMKGISRRIPERVVVRAGSADTDLTSYIPVWNPHPAATRIQPGVANRRLVVVGASARQRALLQQVFPAAQFISLATDESIPSIAYKLGHGSLEHLMWIAPEPTGKTVADEGLLRDQQAGVVQFFRTIKALLSLGYASKDLEYTVLTRRAFQVLPGDRLEPSHAGVHGLAGSLAKEYEHWKIRLLDLDSYEDWPVSQMFENTVSDGNTLAYRNGEWFSQQLIPARSLPSGQSDYRMGGVYVIVGGAGGVGEVLSRYLVERYLAHIVWIGRRPLDESIQRKIRSFPKWTHAPVYITADATDYASLADACAKIKYRFSTIDGVIHCAISLADRSLAKMEEPELLTCLSAKVDVAVRIAQVFGPERPDLILFFSSIQSFGRSPGTANYAAACSFEDAFARRMGQDWPCTVKTVNWGFWGATGVLDTPEYREWMVKSGVGSIQAEEGMAALTELIRSSAPQVVCDKGSRPELVQLLSANELYTAYAADVPSVISALRQVG